MNIVTYTVQCVYNVHLPPIDSYKFRRCCLKTTKSSNVNAFWQFVTMFDSTPVKCSVSGTVHCVHLSLCIQFVSLFTSTSPWWVSCCSEPTRTQRALFWWTQPECTLPSASGACQHIFCFAILWPDSLGAPVAHLGTGWDQRIHYHT